jgi:hypothetical protein
LFLRTSCLGDNSHLFFLSVLLSHISSHLYFLGLISFGIMSASSFFPTLFLSSCLYYFFLHGTCCLGDNAC